MSDDLTVSVGGTSVVVEELVAAARLLDDFARQVAAIRARVAAVDELRSRWWYRAEGAPTDAVLAELDLGDASTALLASEAEARCLGWALGVAADGYALAEDVVRSALGFVADEFGAFVGAVGPGLLALAAFSPVFGAVLGGATLAVRSGAVSRADLNRIASNPLVVGVVRLAVRGADDAVMGRLGVPGPVRHLLGDHGTGLLGVPAVAAAVGAVSRPVGVLRDGEVRVAESTRLPPSPPVAGFEDRVSRIPDPDVLDGAQTIIERYEFPDGRRAFEIYIAGTVDFSPVATDEPWDMASNVSNASGPGSGSYEAVIAAMREAGVRPGDAVQFTGHSQGGAIAARVAASGEFATAGVVSFGGPTGSIPIPADIPTVLVEHTDDMVVALGGDQANETAVVVQRYASGDTDFETAPVMPGHRLDAYRETARLMDAERDGRLAEAAEQARSVTAGAVLVERVAYRCERVGGAPTSS